MNKFRFTVNSFIGKGDPFKAKGGSTKEKKTYVESVDFVRRG